MLKPSTYSKSTSTIFGVLVFGSPLNVISNSGAGYLTDFKVANLLLNCNYDGQNTTITSCGSCTDTTNAKTSVNFHCGFKVNGISVKCRKGVVTGIDVINFGANGMRPQTGAGMEAFAISLATASLDQVGTALDINNCWVYDFKGTNGGYCTAIVVETRDRDVPISHDTILPSGYQRPLGYRSSSSLLASVSSNVVYNVGGIAMGCAVSELAKFEFNAIDNCGAGFNCDTFEGDTNQNITIANNDFLDVYHGINIGVPGWGASSAVFKDFYILTNDFRLKGDVHAPNYFTTINPPTYCGWEKAPGLRLHGRTGDIHVIQNRFSAVAEASFNWHTMGATDKTYTPIQVINNANYKWVDCMSVQPTFNGSLAGDSAGNTYSTSAGNFNSMSALTANQNVNVP